MEEQEKKDEMEESVNLEAETSEAVSAKKKISAFPICVIVGSSVSLAILLMIYILHLCGTSELYDTKITLISVFDMIFEMNFSSGRVLRTLIGLGIAIFYLATVVLMSIRLWYAGKSYIDLLQKWTSQKSIHSKSVLSLSQECLMVFGNLYIFDVFVCLAGGVFDQSILIPMAIFSGLVFIARGVMTHFERFHKFTLPNFVLDTIKDIIIYIGMILLAFLIGEEGTILQIFQGLKMFFTGTLITFRYFRKGLFSLYVGLVDPILVLLLVIFFLILLQDILTYYERGLYFSWDMRRILILLVLMLIVEIVFQCVSGGVVDGASILSLIGNHIREIFPVLTLSIVLFVLLGKYRNDRFENINIMNGRR